ncbi:MAG: NADH-quinone oxidoreductase subunit H [Acidobacteriaceae bacterium]|nr:NADH-quinone oxidoreductase subunit H [Acidobacteriaceae bacterium]
MFPAPYSNWVPTIVFLFAAIVCFFQAAQPRRRRDNITFPIFGIVFLVLAAIWAVPFLQTFLVPAWWFASKVGFLLFTYIWVRGTLPRFRYDQLMKFAWTFLFPCTLLNLLITALLVAVF